MTTNINSYILGTATVQYTNLHNNVFGSASGTAVEGDTQLTITTSGDLSGGGTLTLGSGGNLTLSYTGPTNVSELANDVGYLTSFTETDPTVPTHVKNITTTDISNWDSAFSWGDHSTQGYLTSYTDTNDIDYINSASFNITTGVLTLSGVGNAGATVDLDGRYSTSDTTYSQATNSTLGLVKIGYTENGKNYPVELSNGQMFVNVPWTDTNTDTNTTYTAGTGLTLTGSTFAVDSTIATETYVDAAISDLVNGANASFDTLKEIQDAMATDTELANAISGLVIPSDVSDLTDTTNLLDHFSGAYADLTGKPTNVSEFTNDSNYSTYTSNQETNTTSTVTFDKVRISSTTDAGATSTGHGLQVGTTAGANIIVDTNEVMARNNGAVSGLHLNADGGDVTINNNLTDKVTFSGGEITASGDITAVNFNGVATRAKYADLAEKYTTEIEYPVGTVMMVSFNDDFETAPVVNFGIPMGVISEKPAFLMNEELNGQALALKGRVPVRVYGPIRKGEAVYVYKDGQASKQYNGAEIVGIALETNIFDGEKLVECVLKL